ncbi:Aspartate--tRNA ligase, mitochondrial [Strongyloides ratti]|uniref:Aspartate--tRNA ligase, mitochondrial n=1 Tax=Strongyloides ratti TaxID=34506 RepID=A0A090L0H9_STRRB|nr:Aspartate--tRNA ligase, mitochondrial [Strongyloides ratti]CEF63260.1 Aspartate--tRNA ligase, mitochondrial [Strongyloides ratti]
MFHSLKRLSSSINRYSLRSHNCGELRLKDEGKIVSLYGWVAYKRMDKFVVLKDAYGMTQLQIDDENKELKEIVKNITLESCLSVVGIVKDRKNERNKSMDTGEIEVSVQNLDILNCAPKILPINLKNNNQDLTKWRYRYLDIRSQYMQNNLRLRSSVTNKVRRFLTEEAAFVEIETPTLFRKTPGGAKEFVVPAGGLNKGKFYSLPQSPQQFKQLLMVGSIDKYFQIARCYRDEGAKLDRQPEFTQIDIELSYTNQEMIMELIEDMIISSWPESMEELKPKKNFKQFSYDYVMEKYGSDKPDLRIPWIINDISCLLKDIFKFNFVQCFVARNCFSHISTSEKKKWKKIMENNENCQNFELFKMTKSSWIREGIKEKLVNKFDIKDDDILVVSWGNSENSVKWTLGQLRNYMGEAAGLRKGGKFEICWIVDFPLFIKEEGKYLSCHHPFTAPKEKDLEKLENMEDLLSIKALHYDLVINGVEVGGGSIRIHDGSLQKHVFENILKEPSDEMKYFVEALECGAPPHGGFALGLDRYITLLVGKGDSNVSIKDVIAFPKSKGGRCSMTDSPVELDDNILKDYGITIVKDN